MQLSLACTLLAVGLNLPAISYGSPVQGNGVQLCPLESVPFNYDPNSKAGPSGWAAVSACCGSKSGHQSPIDLPLCPPSELSYKPYKLEFDDLDGHGGLIFNDGNAAVVSIGGPGIPSVKGVPYDANTQYVLDSLHFHFGGSEHALAGQKYSAEMQIVFYNVAYGSVQGAAAQPDGLMVMAVFLQAGSASGDFIYSAELDRLLQKGYGLPVGVDNGLDIEADVSKLMPASGDFYTYAGSMTGPSCSESVRWVVMKQSMMISKEAMAALQSLPAAAGGKIADFSNIRALQQNDQPVETNFDCQ